VRATHRKQELVEVAAVVTEGYAQILRHLEHQILAVVVVVVACTT
jgi:hypothetical protein